MKLRSNHLKIAIIAPPWYPVPPETYGGIERMIENIALDLKNRGHFVTLFCSGDSKVNVKKVITHRQSLVAIGVPFTDLSGEMQSIEESLKWSLQHKPDIVLSILSNDYLMLPYIDKFPCPIIISARNILENRDTRLYKKYINKITLLGLSRSHIRQLKGSKFDGFMYNGVDISKYDFNSMGGTESGFLGNFAPSKGALVAIKVSNKLKHKLSIASKKSTSEYFIQEIEPKFTKTIKYIGEVNDHQKNIFLQNLKVLLFPISRNEPFGSVMIESMACGTPVVAFNCGSVPEIIKDGETGFVVNSGDIRAFEKATEKIYKMNNNDYLTMRENCRHRVEGLFTHNKMVDKYENILYSVVDRHVK